MTKERLLILPQEEFVANKKFFNQTDGESGILGQEWPKLHEDPEWAGWMNYPNEPVTRFLIIRNGDIIAHAAVCERQLENPRIKMVVLGGVLVIKEERDKRYGSRIVEAATNWIISQAGVRKIDIATLTCNSTNEAFYTRFRWKTLPNSDIVRYGSTEESAQVKSDGESTMIIYLSPKARAMQKELESTPIYFGKPF